METATDQRGITSYYEYDVFGLTTSSSKVGYTYTYDGLNRLTAARTTGPYAYWYYDSDYQYDKHGNISSSIGIVIPMEIPTGFKIRKIIPFGLQIRKDENQPQRQPNDADER